MTGILNPQPLHYGEVRWRRADPQGGRMLDDPVSILREIDEGEVFVASVQEREAISRQVPDFVDDAYRFWFA